MSTKGLMAHKRVAEVTLNEAGKAATLTLAEGWTYNGERGPFTLTNVEHGHTIVKGAVSDGSAPSPARKPRAATSAHERPPETNDRGELLHGEKKPLVSNRPLEPRGDTIIVYRCYLVPREGKAGHEVAGWLKTSREYEKEELDRWCWNNLKQHGIRGDGSRVTLSPETHQPKHFRWTNNHQNAARKNEESGSPWAGENHG